jgi:hypothetical protein
MNPKMLNKFIRFHLMDCLTKQNSFFYKYKDGITKIKKLQGKVLMERDDNHNILWIHKEFAEYLQDWYHSTREIENWDDLDYVVQDLNSFLNSANDIELHNNQGIWNPSSLNCQGYEIRIACDYAINFWNRIEF